MAWTIKGEAGAGIDATERALSALNTSSAVLTHASLDADTFEYSCVGNNATGADLLVPSYGQLIELYHNGTRRLRGHVTIPRISNNMLTVTVEGVWWWLKRTMLTSAQVDGVGVTADRASYVFPTQDVKTSITALLTSAIAAGVPMVIGTISNMFAFPRVTLSECSYAQALADLLSIIPDAVAWVDYSVVGLPAINVTRRGDMAALTHTIGTTLCEELDIYPRLDLEVANLTIKSVTRRATDGKTQWATDTAGTSVAGKNQIVVVSGPEINDFLPRDQFDQVDIKAVPLTDSAVAAYILANDIGLATIKRDYGTSLNISGTQEYILSAYTTGIGSGGWSVQMTARALLSKVATANMYVVVSPDRLPEWVREENGYTVTDASIEGWAYYQSAPTKEPGPANWNNLSKRAQAFASGYPYVAGGGGIATVGWYTWVCVYKFNVPVQMINRKVASEFATTKTVYRQWDYDYVSPPAGLAANLLATQSWIPWEGRIQSPDDDLDSAPVIHKKHHVANTLPAAADMGALAKRVTYDINRGRRTIYLGSPARVDFGTLSDKFRRHPKDNIVNL